LKSLDKTKFISYNIDTHQSGTHPKNIIQNVSSSTVSFLSSNGCLYNHGSAFLCGCQNVFFPFLAKERPSGRFFVFKIQNPTKNRRVNFQYFHEQINPKHSFGVLVFIFQVLLLHFRVRYLYSLQEFRIFLQLSLYRSHSLFQLPFLPSFQLVVLVSMN